MSAKMSEESILDADLDTPLLKTHLSYTAIPSTAVPSAAPSAPTKTRSRKCKVITCSIVSIILLLAITAATVLTIIFLQPDEHENWQNRYWHRRRILLWQNRYIYNNEDSIMPAYYDDYKLSGTYKCKFSNCEFSKNNDVRYFNDYHAIIFDMNRIDEQNLKDLFPHQNPNTYYIFAAQNPTSANHRNLHPERTFYNLTMSYKLNSDIIWQPWHFQYKWSQKYASPQETPNWLTPDLSTPSISQVTYLERSKSKLVSAIVPCRNVSKHSRLLEEFQQLMPVEIDNKTDCAPVSLYNSYEDICTGAFNRKYKFFLAFEEQMCDDYVTGNFYRALNCSLVPVVLGGADYRHFAPNHTYIDATAFDTLIQLTDYLYDLERNIPEYAKYFWWKKYYDLGAKNPLCDICEKMMTSFDRKHVPQPSQWHAVDSWWKDSGCKKESKFENNLK